MKRVHCIPFFCIPNSKSFKSAYILRKINNMNIIDLSSFNQLYIRPQVYNLRDIHISFQLRVSVAFELIFGYFDIRRCGDL